MPTWHRFPREIVSLPIVGLLIVASSLLGGILGVRPCPLALPPRLDAWLSPSAPLSALIACVLTHCLCPCDQGQRDSQRVCVPAHCSYPCDQGQYDSQCICEYEQCNNVELYSCVSVLLCVVHLFTYQPRVTFMVVACPFVVDLVGELLCVHVCERVDCDSEACCYPCTFFSTDE